MKKILITVLLFSLSAFCEKKQNLPLYQPETQVDDEVMKFLNDEDSARTSNVNQIVRSKTNRDILGRLTQDTTIYILRKELIEKRIPVGIIDLMPRNTTDRDVFEFFRNQNGDKFARLNGNEISIEEYRDVVQKKAMLRKKERKKPFIRYENLTAQNIKELISSPKPVRIFLRRKLSRKIDETFYPYSYIFDYTGVNAMHSVGAKGNGIGIFFEEQNCPDNTSVLNINNFIQFDNCQNPGRHATKVAKLLQITAPEATIVSFTGFGQGSYSVVSAVADSANQFDPALEIGSYSWHYSDPPCDNDSYCIADQDLDQHIYENRLIYFVAAGNMDNVGDVYVGSPGKALNAITVGAVHPKSGQYISESKWKNSEIENQKPEIANYTNFYFDLSLGGITGTSASTPYSAAIAANILSKDSDLKRHPEVMKSIFLVQATMPIVDASSHDIDDWFSVSYNLPYFNVNNGIAYGWWIGPNSAFFNNGESIVFYKSIVSGLRCKAAISWLTSGSYAGVYKTLAQDLDFFVYQGSDTPLAFSQSWGNPFEILDFTTDGNDNLRFEIKRFSNSGADDVVLGFAMRCDYE